MNVVVNCPVSIKDGFLDLLSDHHLLHVVGQLVAFEGRNFRSDTDIT